MQHVESKPTDKPEEKSSKAKEVARTLGNAVKEPTIDVTMPKKELGQARDAAVTASKVAAAAAIPIAVPILPSIPQSAITAAAAGAGGSLAKPLQDGIKAIPIPDKLTLPNPIFSPGIRLGSEVRDFLKGDGKK